VDLAEGRIENVTTGAAFKAQPFPDFMRRLIDLGGLEQYVRERLGEKENA
jgi:3-isopropylmalate/(R)-2-methylmalate dehydratase small subunit